MGRNLHRNSSFELASARSWGESVELFSEELSPRKAKATDSFWFEPPFRDFILVSGSGRTITSWYLYPRGDLVEPLCASPHFLGRREAEGIEHHPDSIQPVVPECGLPSIVAPNRSQPLRVAIQVREDTANI